MRRAALVILALAFASIGVSARASEARCWLDRGVVVVPAALGRIAGDFILDLSAPRSQLHLTTAEAAGIETPEAVATLRLAGVAIGGARFQVTSLNARSWGFPTNIAGVIGADLLARYVVDLSLKPCRLAIWPGAAPPFAATLTLPLDLVDGVPTLAATASDGHAALAGAFVIDTGSAGVRISDAKAAWTRTPPFDDWAWRLDPPAHLAALSFDAQLIQRPRAALQPAAPPGVLGGFGTDVWSRYMMRLEIGPRTLELAPAP
jgi:hypothetical protein